MCVYAPKKRSYIAGETGMKSDRPPSFPLFISLSAVSSDPANYHSLTVQERKKYRGRVYETGRGKHREREIVFCNNETRQKEQERHTQKTEIEGESLKQLMRPILC